MSKSLQEIDVPCDIFYAKGPRNMDLSDDEYWAGYGLMDPEEQPTTPEEVSTLRSFVETYKTSNPIPASEAARQLMSLSEDRVPCEGDGFDKGSRIAWLLWDVGIEMPHHQPAILVLVEAVQALPRLETTPEQEQRFGAAKLERWRSMEEFWEIWQDTYDS